MHFLSQGSETRRGGAREESSSLGASSSMPSPLVKKPRGAIRISLLLPSGECLAISDTRLLSHPLGDTGAVEKKCFLTHGDMRRLGLRGVATVVAETTGEAAALTAGFRRGKWYAFDLAGLHHSETLGGDGGRRLTVRFDELAEKACLANDWFVDYQLDDQVIRYRWMKRRDDLPADMAAFEMQASRQRTEKEFEGEEQDPPSPRRVIRRQPEPPRLLIDLTKSDSPEPTAAGNEDLITAEDTIAQTDEATNDEEMQEGKSDSQKQPEPLRRREELSPMSWMWKMTSNIPEGKKGPHKNKKRKPLEINGFTDEDRACFKKKKAPKAAKEEAEADEKDELETDEERPAETSGCKDKGKERERAAPPAEDDSTRSDEHPMPDPSTSEMPAKQEASPPASTASSSPTEAEMDPPAAPTVPTPVVKKRVAPPAWLESNEPSWLREQDPLSRVPKIVPCVATPPPKKRKPKRKPVEAATRPKTRLAALHEAKAKGDALDWQHAVLRAQMATRTQASAQKIRHNTELMGQRIRDSLTPLTLQWARDAHFAIPPCLKIKREAHADS